MNNKYDRATVVLTVLMALCAGVVVYEIYKFLATPTGQECAIEVQFKDSKATYIGRIV